MAAVRLGGDAERAAQFCWVAARLPLNGGWTASNARQGAASPTLASLRQVLSPPSTSSHPPLFT